MVDHPVATRAEWLAARSQLLVREKELTRRGDRLAAERRDLPWVRIDKEYLADGAVYLTYSTTARGLEFMMGYYGFLDRAPLGRNEGEAAQMWLRRHDEYA